MIFVTGAARSGTTLITRMLEACGADLGGVGELAENHKFKRKHLKPYLSSLGADPMGIDPLPDPDGEFPPLTFESDSGLIKDPKLALIWKALPSDAKWVIVYRDPAKVAESCLRTPFLGNQKDYDGWLEWAEDYQSRLMTIPKAKVVRTQDVIDDVAALEEVVEWLGLEFDAKKVKKCIRKGKWHGDKTA